MAKVNLIEKSIASALTQLALPMVVGIIAVMSINLVDAYFVGQLGTEPLAAISFTFPVVFTLSSFAIGLGAGTSSVVSRAYGAQEMGRVKQLSTHSLILAFLLVCFASTLGFFTIDLQFSALGASDEILPLIREYMEIWYFGLPFLVIPMVANAIIRAGGDTRIPSFIMVVAALFNIVLDPLFIFGFWKIPPMGIEGAAMASVLARFSTLIFSLSIVIFKEKLLTLKGFQCSEVLESWLKILKVGLPAAIGNMLNPIAIGVVTRIAASFGTTAVAGFGVATRIEAFLCIPLLALSAAMGPFAGQNYGAGELRRLKKAFKLSTLFSGVWCLSLGVVCYFLSETLGALFSSDVEVVKFAAQYLKWVSFSTVGYGVLVIFASGYNAIGYAQLGLFSYFLRNFVLIVPLAYFLSQWLGEAGLFLGIFASNLLTAAILIVFSKYFFKRGLDPSAS